MKTLASIETWLSCMLVLTFCAAPAVSAPAPATTQHWWHTYTPLATIADLHSRQLENIRPGAVRSVGILGWYGFWFLDNQQRSGYI